MRRGFVPAALAAAIASMLMIRFGSSALEEQRGAEGRAAEWLRRESGARGGIVAAHDFLAGVSSRLGSAAVETTTLDLREEDPASEIAKLRASPRDVLLVLEQAAGRQLVLDLAAETVREPAAVFLEPGLHRQIEIYVVKGEPRPPDPGQASPPLVSVASEPAWHGPWVVADQETCESEAPGSSVGACRRVLARGVGGSVRAQALYHFARGLELLGRDGEAEASLSEAIRLVPGDLEQHLAHAWALESLGRHREALATLRQGAPAGDSALVLQRIGWNLARLERWEEAEAALRKSLALDPSFSAALNDRGACLWRLGRREEALAAWREGERREQEDLRARYNLAVARGRG